MIYYVKQPKKRIHPPSGLTHCYDCGDKKPVQDWSNDMPCDACRPIRSVTVPLSLRIVKRAREVRAETVARGGMRGVRATVLTGEFKRKRRITMGQKAKGKK